jgi:putative NIF3 family GTP cyclohydrolase 1 type 2
VRLADLVSWLDETLDARSFKDYGPNGLQVAGAAEVAHLATAVSVSLEVIERAIADGAQALLVHHGLFWQGDDPVIGDLERRRLQTNHALLADLLGLVERAPFGEHGGVLLGVQGALPSPASVTEVAATLGAQLGSTPLVLAGGEHPVLPVGIVSGGAAKDIRQAALAGLDAFITGEPREDSAYLARELGVHLIAAGHNATETVGVQALGAAAAERFGITTVFLPVVNPV